MALELKCKLSEKLAGQNGQSTRGEWTKQDFIVETLENYPKKVCMNVWGNDKVSDLAQFNPGDILNISINIESREFNGRWYTDVRAWRITKDSPVANQQSNMPPVSDNDPFNGITEEDNVGEDLPF